MAKDSTMSFERCRLAYPFVRPAPLHLMSLSIVQPWLCPSRTPDSPRQQDGVLENNLRSFYLVQTHTSLRPLRLRLERACLSALEKLRWR
jgi:hypothetical protein